LPRIAQLFQGHPNLAVRRTAIRLLASNEARRSRVHAPAPLGTVRLLPMIRNGVVHLTCI
jgi:hypothetical protein